MSKEERSSPQNKLEGILKRHFTKEIYSEYQEAKLIISQRVSPKKIDEILKAYLSPKEYEAYKEFQRIMLETDSQEIENILRKHLKINVYQDYKEAERLVYKFPVSNGYKKILFKQVRHGFISLAIEKLESN